MPAAVQGVSGEKFKIFLVQRHCIREHQPGRVGAGVGRASARGEIERGASVGSRAMVRLVTATQRAAQEEAARGGPSGSRGMGGMTVTAGAKVRGWVVGQQSVKRHVESRRRWARTAVTDDGR